MITAAKKRIEERRSFVREQYQALPEDSSVSLWAKAMAKKYKVTEVTIYKDVKDLSAKKREVQLNK